MMKKFNTNEIKASHEGLLAEEFGPAFLLKHFPVHTSPFWNMKLNKLGTAEKIDVIL
jgi:aspartyl/asparaginyl-tRNA synthetase